jgi:membrane protease YdiL (CAAX protease family)
MLIRNTNCPKCGHIYDSIERHCPKCSEANPNPMSHKKCRGLVWLPKWQEITFFLLGWFGLNIIATLVQLAFSYLNTDGNEVLFMSITQFITYGILFLGMFILVVNNHRKIFVSFKKIEPYVIGIGIGAIIILLSGLYSRIVSSFYTFNVNENESLIREITISYPVFAFLIFVFVGPICEELTYRLGLFTLSARLGKWVAYLVTVSFFALIHFDFFAGSAEGYIVELLNLPSYIIAGALLCFAYDYFGLAASVTAHVVNNMIAITSILFLNGIS